MSDSSHDISEFIAEASQIRFSVCVNVAATGKSSVFPVKMPYMLMKREALVFYDYILTLPTEVSEIWNSKFSGAHALFYLTRYSYIISTIFETAWFIMSQIGLYGSFVLLPQRTIDQHGVGKRHPFILVIGGFASVVYVSLLVYMMVVLKPGVHSSALGGICNTDPPNILHLKFTVQLAIAIIGFILDILVFTLTLAKTIHHAKEMRKVGLGNGLGYFILRDVATLLGTIGEWGVVVGNLDNPLIYVLINRLVLNLRQVSHKQVGNSSTFGAIGTIQKPVFATNSFLGNLGAPLHVGPEDDDEIEEVGMGDEADVVEESRVVDYSETIKDIRDPSDF
ncbi:hypothetical protein BD410DRAFT_806367 [Rickenella mellea]|uniref:DUF6533 domain-containing protein n=1 Tax=Rickenella mellea TaxID=50990 RepID=A0A4Y7PUD6_9AGAM|nr:hypothetical protein BD410DRAFT_806367 [Rickenella mellea]